MKTRRRAPVMALHLRADDRSPRPSPSAIEMTGAAVALAPDDYGACEGSQMFGGTAEILFAGGELIRCHACIGEELTRFAVDDVGDCVVAVPRGAPPADFARRIAAID